MCAAVARRALATTAVAAAATHRAGRTATRSGGARSHIAQSRASTWAPLLIAGATALRARLLAGHGGLSGQRRLAVDIKGLPVGGGHRGRLLTTVHAADCVEILLDEVRG